jgi:RHS repeat-associated protein
MADGSYWEYQYDDLGQVTCGIKYNADGLAVPGCSFGYNFDQIGNRTTVNANGRESVYASNSLNQYDSRTVPNVVTVTGSAVEDATVKIIRNSDATVTVPVRNGRNFSKEFTVDNSSGPVSEVFDVYAVRDQGAAGTLVRRETLTASVPGSPQTFQYDDDGNLVNDGLWNYIWNAENRLISAERPGNAGLQPRIKVEYAYDYQGRRTLKRVYSWVNDAWQLDKTITFVYDGYNEIAHYTDGILTAGYTWGEDLSGSLQGAGGVGGLLAVTDNAGKAYLPCYDGNGNIVSYINSADGKPSADYEYGTFGGLTCKSGLKADDFAYRFSTKRYDSELNLYFYNIGRGYCPETGRWLNRDMIEELGGKNLYGWNNNDAINRIDILGFASGQVLWIIQNDATQYKAEVERAINTIVALDAGGSSGSSRIVPLILQQGRQLRPPNYGRLPGNPVPYVIHLKVNGVIDDICWDRVYAMSFEEGTKGMPPHDTNTFTLDGLNPLGHGNAWEVIIWPKRIDEEVKLLKDNNEYPSGANLNNWVFIAIMHEAAHGVGVSHIFEGTMWNKFWGSYQENLKRYPNNLMRPIGSYDWFFGIYTIEEETKNKIIERFGF